MIGPADHALERQSVRFAGLNEGVYDKRSAVRRRIGIDLLQLCLDATSERNVF